MSWNIKKDIPESAEHEWAVMHPNKTYKISGTGTSKMLERLKNIQDPVLLGELDKIMQLRSPQTIIPTEEIYWQSASFYVLSYNQRSEALNKNKLILYFLQQNCQNIKRALNQKEKRQEFLDSLKQKSIDKLPIIFDILLQINGENPETLTLDEINAKIEIGLRGDIPSTSKTARTRYRLIERTLKRHKEQEAQRVERT
ncbi:MAG: hypothetical protein PHY80_03890 [Rickettsiales bacterium]|nr:hypothetical protein [Rickettsiales bacterium]